MRQEESTTLVDQPVIERLPQTSPADEVNRELVRNVHPLDWVNPKPSGRYNLVVIGAGIAGLVELFISYQPVRRLAKSLQSQGLAS